VTTIKNTKEIKVSFGPELSTPSWNWVGFDTSRELSKYFKVDCFSDFKSIPVGDVIVFVKKKPKEDFIDKCLKAGKKVIYIPIDYYLTHNQLKEDANIFRKINMTLIHCERLRSLIEPYCKKIKYVDHNNKYGLTKMNPYKENGFILWLGGLEHVGHLLKWLRRSPLKHPVKLLTNINCDRAIFAANNLNTRLFLDVKISAGDKTIDGHEVIEWSERTQYEMMSEAKAGIDIKGTDFNQWSKPATKLQQGISCMPFSVNNTSYSYEYIKNKGFNMVEPSNQLVWFSKQYWEKTCEISEVIRKETSLEFVGLKYKEYIESIL
jgi:hypothetical protein